MTPVAAKNAIRQWYHDMVVSGSPPVEFVTEFDNQPVTNAAGEKIEKPTDSPWVRFSINFSDSQQVEVAAPSANTHRHLGLAIAQVFIPADESDTDGWAIANFIADQFRGVIASGVRFQTPTFRVAGRTDNWWQINVICPYRFDQIG